MHRNGYPPKYRQYMVKAEILTSKGLRLTSYRTVIASGALDAKTIAKIRWQENGDHVIEITKVEGLDGRS